MISKYYLKYLLPAFIFPYLIFIKLPFDFISHNLLEIIFPPSSFLFYFILFCITFTLLFFVSINFSKLREKLLRLSVAFFGFIFIEEILYSIYWADTRTALILLFLVELILIYLLIKLFLSLEYSKLFVSTLIALISILTFDVINYYQSFKNLQSKKYESNDNQNDLTINLKHSKFKSQYVYHLVLDGFTSHVFNHLINTENLINDFDGYIFYKNNKANYGRTHLSVPSYLSGNLYNKKSLNQFPEFMINNWKDGYPKILSQNQISQAYFTYIRSYFNSYICNNNKLAYCESYVDKYAINPNKNDSYLPLDIIFYKIMPSSIKFSLWRLNGYKERPAEIIELPFMISRFLNSFTKDHININNNEKWESNRHIQSYSYNGFLDFLQWDKNYGKNIQYKYVHLLIPHGPYTRDKNCNLKKIPNDVYGSIEHHKCGIHIINLLNNHLKKLGRFKESTIIINSDHGTVSDFIDRFPAWDNDFLLETQKNPSLLDKKIIHKNKGNVSDRPASQIELRAAALLLIKNKGKENEDLIISKFNSQLVDLYPTILSLFNINPNKKMDGINLNKLNNENILNIRKQIYHATNENTPEDVTKLQSYIRKDAGWILNGDALELEN